MLPVWVEMLLYAAERCSFDSHARNLAQNNGGEFVTILWLVFKYHILTAQAHGQNFMKLKEAEEEEEGIGEEELKQYDGSDPTKPLRSWPSRARFTTSPRAGLFLTPNIYPNMHAFPLFSSVIDQTNGFVAFVH